MTAVAPTGNGPFEFTNSDGKLVSIPLSALSFGATGNLVGPLIIGISPAKDLLAYMRAQGIIVPAPVASPKPAAIIRAVDPGPGGNNIAVTIQNIVSSPDPTQVTFDIQVTETETYPGLTAATIQSVLGTATASGSQPGLVHVKSVAKPTGLPAALSKTPLGGGASGVNATLPVDDAALDLVFTLEARDPGPDGDLIDILITLTGTTFTLTAQWTKPAATARIGTFQKTVADNFSYEITAAPPAGGIFSVPTAITTNLSGGAGSVSASAILVASQ